MEAIPSRIKPVPSTSISGLPVLFVGLLTTAAALLGVWYAGKGENGENIMGWYADYVIPAGALLVGIVAGTGYGLGSWWSGLRIGRKILVVVLILQFAAYWVAQYLSFHSQHLVYRSTGEPMGFFDYYHLTTINMAWKPKYDEHPSGGSQAVGNPLGMWGYGLRVLEIIGFVGGAMIILLALRAKPYCETCRVYMKSKVLPTLPASVKARKVKKNDPEGQAAYFIEQQAAVDGGAALLNEMTTAAKTGDLDTFQNIVDAARPSSKKAKKLPRRIAVKLVYCKKCCDGRLVPEVVTGQGKAIKRFPLEQVPTPQDFVRGTTGAIARP